MNQHHHSASSPQHDELSIDVDVVEDEPARHRPDDTWQALGRALGEAQASVVIAPYVAAPPQRHVPAITKATPPARVPESLYPVEVPVVQSPHQPAAAMSAQLPAWPFKDRADASLSLQVPVRKPRALSTARWAVAGVTAVGGLVCVLALIMSHANDESAPATQSAAAAPPAAETTIPEKQGPRDDGASQGAANLQGSSWTKNVMGKDKAQSGSSGVGVSVDSLPRVDDAKPAPRKKKR